MTSPTKEFFQLRVCLFSAIGNCLLLRVTYLVLVLVVDDLFGLP